MAHWFEDVTKTLADEKLSRRTALQRVASSIAGIALASVFSGTKVFASPSAGLKYKTVCNKSCPNGGGNCSSGFSNCNNPNTNCFCFTDTNGTAVCGCNSFCSQSPSCSTNKQCGKNNVCITANGCTGCASSGGVCVPNCAKKKNKNCQIGSGHGLTAASASQESPDNLLIVVISGNPPNFGGPNPLKVNKGDLVLFANNTNIQLNITVPGGAPPPPATPAGCGLLIAGYAGNPPGGQGYGNYGITQNPAATLTIN